jgi:DNA repair protein RecO (recombination protein O)
MNDPRERIAVVAEDGAKGRHDDEPAYVLHTYPYRETSLVAELFTRQHGRVALVARGAKRAKSAVRGVLQPFQPLSISWFGRSELRTLAKAEWQRALPQLAGTALMCGFYLNELLLKLTRRDDAHDRLFDYYAQAIAALSAMGAGNGGMSVLLRRFELGLLKELGYAVPLEADIETGEAVVYGGTFEYVIERGPVAAKADPGRIQFRGKSLLDFARDDYSDPVTIQETKQLMRMLINHYLGGQLLHTRQFIKELRDL